MAPEMEFDPRAYPPFPSGLPIVELETYSLAQLEKGDEELEGRLFETCKTRGFFYLDLESSTASSLPKDSEAIARLAEQVFKLPLEEKEKYPMKDSIFGYHRYPRSCLSSFPPWSRHTLTPRQIQKGRRHPHRLSRHA